MNVLYISYTGMTDSLGESQVLSYLIQLSVTYKHAFHIVSAEKPKLYSKNRNRVQSLCDENSITWHPIVYHKQPPIFSTVADHLALKKAAFSIARKESIHLVHCRGYLPMLSGIAVKKAFGVPLIFDMRGFWPDEKLESGAWAGYIYKPIFKYFKKKEVQFFQAADYTVSLTHSGKEEIEKAGWIVGEQIGVIPTCVNFGVFKEFDVATRATLRAELGISAETSVLVYSGSLGGNYDPEIPFQIFKGFQLLDPDAHFLILSRTDPDIVQSYALDNGVSLKSVSIVSVPFHEVSKYLMVADLGLVFYGPGYSNKGRSPTKLGEYWATGLPVISLPNIGDVEAIIRGHPDGGAIIASTDPQTIYEEINGLPQTTDRSKLRRYAEQYYSLDKGVTFYNNLYKMLGDA